MGVSGKDTGCIIKGAECKHRGRRFDFDTSGDIKVPLKVDVFCIYDRKFTSCRADQTNNSTTIQELTLMFILHG